MLETIASEEVRNLLREAVATDSVNHNYDENRSGEAGLCDWVELFFQKHAIPYQSQGVRNRQRNLIGRIEGQNPQRLLCFEAHMDTTTARGMSVHPFGAEEIQGAVWGRGTCDCKSSLAAMLVALKALKTLGDPPPQTVLLAATVDKEVGMAGIGRLLASGLRPQAVVVGGPTNLGVGSCCRGCLRWRIALGESPQSYAPASRNAIRDAVQLITRLEIAIGQLAEADPHPLLGNALFQPSRIRGNSLEGFCPPHCAVEFETYTVPGCDNEAVLEGVRDTVGNLLAEEPTFKVTIESPTVNDPPVELPEGSRLAKAAMRACSEVLGSARLIGYPDNGHANRLVAAGIEAIVLGPGDPALIRSPEEHVPIDQLGLAAQVYLRLMRTPLV